VTTAAVQYFQIHQINAIVSVDVSVSSGSVSERCVTHCSQLTLTLSVCVDCKSAVVVGDVNETFETKTETKILETTVKTKTDVKTRVVNG